MVIPFINGRSYTALNVQSEALAEALEAYYLLAGFEQESPRVLSNASHSVYLKIEVSPLGVSDAEAEERHQRLVTKAAAVDLRAVEGSTTFETDDVAGVARRLAAAGMVVQGAKDPGFAEIYSVDPAGSVVGWTLRLGFQTVPPPATAAPTASISAAAVTSVPAPDAAPNVKSIAVLTSGGDSPGMNPTIQAIVRQGLACSLNMFCVYEGYEGLVSSPPLIKPMSWALVSNWLAEGGTNIGTARLATFRTRRGRLLACHNLIRAGIDALIVIGGDGSLTGADRFRAEWPELIDELHRTNAILAEQLERHRHLNICGAVGSIDNDMSMTDATIGCYSSLTRICGAIDYLNATASSHSRAFVVEVMGRHCGWLALMAGIATAADYILIPEKPAAAWQARMRQVVGERRAQGRRKTIVIVAEGAVALDLTPITSAAVLEVLQTMGLDTRVTVLGHVQRGGTACAYDRLLGTLQGVEAVAAVMEGTPETPLPMIGIAGSKIVRRSLAEAVEATQSVAAAIEERDFDKAMGLRDPEFVENLQNYLTLNSAGKGAPASGLKFAVINVGAPAGGMNAAVYSFAAYCLAQGHTPYAIHNGFSGLARHESVRLMDWLAMEGWNSLGGSEIGTNRTTPHDTDVSMIAYYFAKYGFDGLVLVGGFEAFESLQQLEAARADYPAFRIPMVLIPATISNNVPGTDVSLGTDTCLNSLMEYCDVIEQSATSTRDRVFVVEVQGGNCGYVATIAGLITGAFASYVPEEGISLKRLENDVAGLQREFAADKAGKVVLKSANSSKVFTTEVLASIMNDAGKFTAKTAIPGHVQQGGIPSPMDRTKSQRMAVRAVDWMVAADAVRAQRDAVEYEGGLGSASVLGVVGSELRFTEVRKLYDEGTDVGRRMPKDGGWHELRVLAERLNRVPA